MPTSSDTHAPRPLAIKGRSRTRAGELPEAHGSEGVFRIGRAYGGSRRERAVYKGEKVVGGSLRPKVKG